MSSSSSSSSLVTIQKPRAKRTLLPKSSLIQLFIENAPNLNDLTTTASNKTRILPKFNDQDLIKQFNLAPSNELNKTTLRTQTTSSPASISTSQNVKSNASPNQFKKLIKDNKFKQITRLCLYQSEQQHEEKSLDQDIDKSNLNSDTCQLVDLNQHLQQQTINQHKNRHNLLKHLSKEFLIDCKQRLDLNTFKILLELLAKYKKDNNLETSSSCLFSSNLDQLDEIYQIIKNDFNLCNKFSAFLTSEYAVHFNLFMQSTQYEKTYNLLQKLDLFIPNKCAFKKMIQSIQSTSEQTLESNQFKQIIDDIKSKINASTKNNQLIYDELEYLFDQRNANLEPVYEKISLVDMEKVDMFLNEEFIDLTMINQQQKQTNSSSNVNKSKRKKKN